MIDNSEMENNPVTKKRWDLHGELGVTGWSVEYLTYPKMSDNLDFGSRIKFFDEVIRYGSRITINCEFGDLKATAWVPNFKVMDYSGITICEEIAGLLVLERLKSRRSKTKNN